MERFRTDRSSIAVGIGGTALPIVCGAAVGLGVPEVAIVVCVFVVGSATFSRLSLFGWCFLILLTSVAIRAPVALLGLPPMTNFLHYPLTLAFALTASLRTRLTPGSQSVSSRWILILIVLAGASMLINLSHPVRALVFLLILGEPLLLIWAIHKWGEDKASEARLLRLCSWLLVVQIPIAIAQGIVLGWTDPVQGLLIGHGAGAHIFGGLLALGLLAIASAVADGRFGLVEAALACAVLLAMMIAAGAAQVVIACGVALGSFAFAVTDMGSSSPAFLWRRLRFGFSAACIAVVALLTLNQVVPAALERAQGLVTRSDLPEIRLLRERASSDRVALIIGSGPGTSASRASLLLTPSMMKEGSPLAFLGLPPTEEASRIANQTLDPFGGSAEAFGSSALGVLGDLGLVGLLALVLFFISLWRRAGLSNSWIGTTVRMMSVMIGVLLFVDNWLEYPEFSLPAAILVAFATSPFASPAQHEFEIAERRLTDTLPLPEFSPPR